MKSIRIVLFVLYSLNSFAYINNGIPVDQSKHPTVVRLGIESRGGSAICTATYIAKNKILTAHHCVADTKARWLEIDGQKTEILKIDLHPKIEENLNQEVELRITLKKMLSKKNPSVVEIVQTQALMNAYMILGEEIIKNDIAVLTTNDNHSYTQINFDRPNVGDQVGLIGYGMNGFDHESAGILRKGSNTISSVSETNIQVMGRDEDASSWLVLSRPTGKKVTANHGDSGGPLVSNGKIVGVASQLELIGSGFFQKLILKFHPEQQARNYYAPLFPEETKEFLLKVLSE